MNDAFYEHLAVGSQIAASILFIVVLVYLYRRFLAPAVVASQAKKNAELSEAEQRRDASKAEVGLAQREAKVADDDVAAIVGRGRADAAQTRARIVREGRAESERLVRNAEGELERGRLAARERLRGDLLERAIAIARRAALQVDDTTNRRLVAEAVDTVDPGGRE